MHKILQMYAVIFLLLLSAPGSSYAYDKAGHDCSKCHTLSKEQASETLNVLIPDIKVLEVNQGPVAGLWEVAFQARGQKYIIYLDYAAKKIMNGSVIGIRDRKDYTQETMSRINRVDLSTFPFENSLVMGDINARKKVVVFDDPD